MYTNEALGKALEDLTTAYNNFITKAKEAALAAMGDTVIAQIKQDAKDHIAAELAAQKAALEEAIQAAKQAIKNSVNEGEAKIAQMGEAKKEELNALIAAAELALNEKVNESKSYIDAQLSAASAGVDERIKMKVSEIFNGEEERLLKKVDQKFIKHYPKCYLQMPGMPSPLEDTSMHYAGYSWYEVNLDGNFFRAKGRDAKPFSDKKLTTEQIKNGSYVFQDDEQGDAIRNISALSGSYMAFREKYPGTDGQGAFYRDWTYAIGAGGPSTTDYLHLGTLGFLASRVVPTANENRSRNLTVVFWFLVKNE